LWEFEGGAKKLENLVKRPKDGVTGREKKGLEKGTHHEGPNFDKRVDGKEALQL